MADQTVVHIGENSPEQVAYKLMEAIAKVEHIALIAGDLDQKYKRADRSWILTTYRECLYSVKHQKVPESGG
jgi:hypothetical protein